MSPSLKEERIREYFIRAAEEIIRGEGIRAASARTIAERAGYSYATIYNHFEDLNDLYTQVGLSIQSECREFVQNQSRKKETAAERIQEKTRWYVTYFIQYPTLFHLFFDKSVRFKQEEIGLDCFFTSLMGDDTRGRAGFEEYLYAVHGLMLFALNRFSPLGYDEVMSKLEKLTA